MLKHTEMVPHMRGMKAQVVLYVWICIFWSWSSISTYQITGNCKIYWWIELLLIRLCMITGQAGRSLWRQKVFYRVVAYINSNRTAPDKTVYSDNLCLTSQWKHMRSVLIGSASKRYMCSWRNRKNVSIVRLKKCLILSYTIRKTR